MRRKLPVDDFVANCQRSYDTVLNEEASQYLPRSTSADHNRSCLLSGSRCLDFGWGNFQCRYADRRFWSKKQCGRLFRKSDQLCGCSPSLYDSWCWTTLSWWITGLLLRLEIMKNWWHKTVSMQTCITVNFSEEEVAWSHCYFILKILPQMIINRPPKVDWKKAVIVTAFFYNFSALF